MADPDYPSITIPAGKIYLTPVGGAEAYIGQTDGADIAREPRVEERWAGVGPQLKLADAVPVSADTIITVRCQESRDNTLALGLMAEVDDSTPGVTRIVPRTDLSVGAVVALRHAADPTVGRARSLRVARALVLPNGPVRLKRSAAGGEVQVVDLRFRVLWTGSSAPDWWFEEPDGSVVDARAGGASWPVAVQAASGFAGADWPMIGVAMPDLSGASWPAAVQAASDLAGADWPMIGVAMPDLSGAAWSATVSPVASLEGAAWLAAPVPAPHDPRAWCGCPGAAEWSITPPPPPPPPLPSFNVLGSVAHPEGNTGATEFVYVASRTPSTGVASVDWAVVGTGLHPANADDFVGGVLPSGTLEFADGEASKNITIQVQGDLDIEADEFFRIELSNPIPANADLLSVGDAQIVNDDFPPPAPNLMISTPGTLAFTGDFGATYTRTPYPEGINPPFVSLASDRAGNILGAFNTADGLDMGFAYSMDYGQTWGIVDTGPSIAAPDSAYVRFGDGIWVIFATDASGAIYSATDPLGVWTAHAAPTSSLPIVDMVYSSFGYWVALMSGPLIALQSSSDFDSWSIVADAASGSDALHLDDYEVGAAGRSLCANESGVLAIVQPVGDPWLGLMIDGFGLPDPAASVGLSGVLHGFDTPPFHYDTESPGVMGSPICPMLRRTGLDCIGGVRDMVLVAADVFVAFIDGHSINFAHGANGGEALSRFVSTFSSQTYIVYWNGPHGYHEPRNGLGAVNLVAGGANGIYLDVIHIPLGAELTLTLWSNGGAVNASSVYSYVGGPSQPFFLFADFSGVDPTSISAIALQVVAGSTDMDYANFTLRSISAVKNAPDLLLIDNFAEPIPEQAITFEGGTPSNADENVYGAVDTALGGYRGIRMFFPGDPVTMGDRTCMFVAGFGSPLTFIPVEGTFGIEAVGLEALWNGPTDFDGPFDGLGSVDLTVGGGNGIYVENAGTSPATLTLWSNAGADTHSVSGTLAPITTPSAGVKYQFFNFSHFIDAGVDVTDISAMRISWLTLIGIGQVVPRIAVRYFADKAGVLASTDGDVWSVVSSTLVDTAVPDPAVPMDVLRAKGGGLAGSFIGVPRSGTLLPAISYAAAGAPGFGYSWNTQDADSPSTDYYEGVQPVGGDFVMIGGGAQTLYRLNGGPWSAMPDAGVDSGDLPRSLVAIR